MSQKELEYKNDFTSDGNRESLAPTSAVGTQMNRRRVRQVFPCTSHLRLNRTSKPVLP